MRDISCFPKKTKLALLAALAAAIFTATPHTAHAGVLVVGPGGQTGVLNSFVFFNPGAPAGFQFDYQYQLTNVAPLGGVSIDGFNLFTGGPAGLAAAVAGVNNFSSDADAGVAGIIPASAAGGALPAFMTQVSAGIPFPPRWGFTEWDNGAGTDYLARWFALLPINAIQPQSTRIFDIFSANGPIPGNAFVDPPAGDVVFSLDFTDGTDVVDTTDLTATVTDTPEPATLTLLAAPVVIGLMRRRRASAIS